MRGAICAALLLSAATAHAQSALTLDEDGVIRQGDRVLSQRELYTLAGRTDLLANSDANLARRRWLLVGAAVAAVGFLPAGGIVLATTPDLNAPYCVSSVQRYNDDCVAQVALHQRLGAGLLVAGAVATSLLLSIAWWNGPDVLTRREVQKLVEAQGGALTWELAPVAGPQLAGLVVRGRF